MSPGFGCNDTRLSSPLLKVGTGDVTTMPPQRNRAFAAQYQEIARYDTSLGARTTIVVTAVAGDFANLLPQGSGARYPEPERPGEASTGYHL